MLTTAIALFSKHDPGCLVWGLAILVDFDIIMALIDKIP